MEWKPEIKDSEFVPQKRKPTEETVCYKIDSTYYEVSTSCGGSERLRDKMIRLIKSETVVLNHLKIWLFRCMIFQRNTVTYGIYGGIKIMITESKYPILEFDNNKVAKLNPTSFVAQSFETDKLIITFFPEVMDKLVEEGKIIHEKRLVVKTRS